jgi:adenylyltransferase/sulfurtransferase
LKHGKALMIGLGGLGSPVALYLAAAGVGELHLADFDTVDLTNLQRQVIHDTDSVGMSKVDSAIKRLQAINPEITWSPIARRWTRIRRRGGGGGPGAGLLRQLLHPRGGQRRLCRRRQAVGQRRGDPPRRAVVGVRPAARRSPCYHCLYGHGSEAELTCSEAGVLGPLVGWWAACKRWKP